MDPKNDSFYQIDISDLAIFGSKKSRFMDFIEIF